MIPTYVGHDELWSGKAMSNIQRRIKTVLKFCDVIKTPIADMGMFNPLAKAMEDYLLLPIDSVNYDFDTEKYSGEMKYGTVLCFEVLEHLFNPLFFLENLKDVMTDDGVLYLSVPGRIKLLWGPHHYHEPDDKRLGWLFERAGFKVEKKGKAPAGGKLRYHLLGIRLFMRYFCKTRLFKLVKEV